LSSTTGTVVARYKRHCLVQQKPDERVSCQIQRRSLKPVVGDSVEWQREADDTGTVTAVLPRRTELTRIDNRGRPEIVAANVTDLVIVLAADPPPDWFLLDRYLAAAELGQLGAVIVFNKSDLPIPTPSELGDYEQLGYVSHRTSARSRGGLVTLADTLRGKRSVMIGQSGVGKSSLLNALVGEASQSVGALSEKSGQGRHTTSTAVLYSLPGGGELIDSPGVRDYAPYIADPRAVTGGFREFQPLTPTCRFQDCRHLSEPNCAVKRAVMEGRIAQRRYASYRRLYELSESLQAGRY
jgi:ribosome biogenesis GTPase